jgi:hypothetical protein
METPRITRCLDRLLAVFTGEQRSNEEIMRRIYLLILVAATFIPVDSAQAQAGFPNGLGDLILELRQPRIGGTLPVLGPLFSGLINATVFDRDGNPDNFAGNDLVAFTLASARPGGGQVQFSGTRPEFDAWVEANRAPLLSILFPVSLSEGGTGVDVAQSVSQSFLLSTALGAGGRGRIGGRVEWEGFDLEQYSGNAIQGLFRVRSITVEGRFTQLHDALDTRSVRGGINVHPYWRRSGATTEWRAGADGYFSALYSASSALDLGSLDYGGGGWASGRVELTRASVSFGGILLGSKSHIPLGLVTDTYDFVAEEMNDRPIRWDLTIGGSVETPLSNSVAVGGQFLNSQMVGGQFHPVQFPNSDDPGRTSQLFLGYVAYLIGGDRRLDFGYRYSTGGERYHAHGIFMNANFAF